MGETNGVAADRLELQEQLTGEPLTTGYRPTVPLSWTNESDWTPQIYLLRDIELMMVHPIVLNALNYFKCGIAGAEFWGGEAADGNPDGAPVSDNPEVAAFVESQAARFWDRGVPRVQGGYDYGWMGLENNYAEEDGRLCWESAVQFSPRDVFLLTRDYIPVGVRVKNVRGSPTGNRDLWLGSPDVPAKGFWYAHQPRYNHYYGQSQLLGAWRPWRRLAWKDGAETVIDTGVYRFAYAGPEVGYPEEDLQTAQPGVPGTTLDAQGKPRRYARDIARQIAEQAKAGAGIGLPTTPYPNEQGGKPKWTLKWPEHAFDVGPLVAYAKYLQDQICYGVGVSPELLAAAETGSGYSGRTIVLDAFLYQQQRIADHLLHLFIDQVLIPLVRWNFGPEARFRLEVKNLLQSKNAARQVQQQQEKGTPPPEKKPDSPLEPGIEGKSTPGWPRTPEQTQANTAQAFSINGDSPIHRIAARILRRVAA